MRLGNDVVTVVTVTENPAVRDRYNQPTLVRTETVIPGCRFRPVPSREVSDGNGTTASDPHRLTAPPVAALVNASSRDEIVHDGTVYRILGLVRVHTDFSGRVSHLTVSVERQLG